MIPGLIQPITPSDTTPVQGVSTLLVIAAGNLVLRGTQTGAAATAAFPVVAGQQIYFPDTGFVMAAGTTATVVGMG